MSKEQRGLLEIEEEVESYIPTKATSYAPLQHFKKIFRQVAEAAQSATVPLQAPAPPSKPPIDKLRNGATEFKGRKENNASVLNIVYKVQKEFFWLMQCSPKDSLICPVSLLKEEAYQWQDTVAETVLPVQRIYEIFLTKFRKWYVGDIYLEEKKRKLIYLK